MWAVNGGGMASKIWVRAITAAAAVGLWIPAAVIGQSTGGTTTPPTTGTGSTTGSTGGGGAAPGGITTPSPTTTTASPTSTPATAGTPQPFFVGGRVMWEDGPAPADLAVIETVCNGSTHSE